MRGTEATSKLRQLGYKGIIIGITGNALDDDVKDFTDHGADKVLPKPFDLLEFKKALLAIAREKLKKSSSIDSAGAVALMHCSSRSSMIV